MNNEVAFKLDVYKFTKAILNFDIPQNGGEKPYINLKDM